MYDIYPIFIITGEKSLSRIKSPFPALNPSFIKKNEGPWGCLDGSLYVVWAIQHGEELSKCEKIVKELESRRERGWNAGFYMENFAKTMLYYLLRSLWVIWVTCTRVTVTHRMLQKIQSPFSVFIIIFFNKFCQDKKTGSRAGSGCVDSCRTMDRLFYQLFEFLP